MNEERLQPILPGEVLSEEFLKPMGLSQNKLAMDIHVPARRINEIVQGRRRITVDTALRLARYFGVSPQFWLGLQMDYDLDVASDELAERLDREITATARPCEVNYLNQLTDYPGASRGLVLADRDVDLTQWIDRWHLCSFVTSFQLALSAHLQQRDR